MNTVARYWKAIAAVVGLVLTLLTSLQSVWGDSAPEWVPFAVAALTAISVYRVENAPLPEKNADQP